MKKKTNKKQAVKKAAVAKKAAPAPVQKKAPAKPAKKAKKTVKKPAAKKVTKPALPPAQLFDLTAAPTVGAPATKVAEPVRVGSLPPSMPIIENRARTVSEVIGSNAMACITVPMPSSVAAVQKPVDTLPETWIF